LKAPAVGTADRKRASLLSRLEKLRDLYEWSDVDEAQYRAKREALERELLLTPDHDKLGTSPATATSWSRWPTTSRRRVERSGGRCWRSSSTVSSPRAAKSARSGWTPAAHPFFGGDRTLTEHGVVVLARPEGIGRARTTSDPLAWYLESA
jgi:hypothetical protein